MIIYLHGFDSTSPGNHEKILQLQFIDDDVRFINYSTLHPKHDMQHLLKEVHKVIEQSDDPHPIICGVGLFGMISGLITSMIVAPRPTHSMTSEQSEKLLKEILTHQQIVLSRLEKLEKKIN